MSRAASIVLLLYQHRPRPSPARAEPPGGALPPAPPTQPGRNPGHRGPLTPRWASRVLGVRSDPSPSSGGSPPPHPAPSNRPPTCVPFSAETPWDLLPPSPHGPSPRSGLSCCHLLRFFSRLDFRAGLPAGKRDLKSRLIIVPAPRQSFPSARPEPPESPRLSCRDSPRDPRGGRGRESASPSSRAKRRRDRKTQPSRGCLGKSACHRSKFCMTPAERGFPGRTSSTSQGREEGGEPGSGRNQGPRTAQGLPGNDLPGAELCNTHSPSCPGGPEARASVWPLKEEEKPQAECPSPHSELRLREEPFLPSSFSSLLFSLSPSLLQN
nr:nascent polypeptide-associated complex subunit alpha, muscle-specific form-like [Gorilla gorilla gorilla]